ncbi:uncharacterized protein LOC111328397 [Stylophora pistillata]|uniref:uncharacterized protein LOC111328397 n=1 Tax=Stylophora pistillata TaxID=50429 RepID=UPI000C040899|nr:uncharacterized protein LOC111328397 [Stylophora pistillata]
MVMANARAIFLFLLICSILKFGSSSRRGKKKHAAAYHNFDKVKKQQVVVPLTNFPPDSYVQNNIMPSQILHLDGTNELSPLKSPSTVFLNGENEEDQTYPSIDDSHQTDTNDEPYPESPTEDNTYNTAYSSLFGNEMEDYHDVVNNDDNNAALKDNNGQATYDEQPNEEYVNDDTGEEQNPPVRTTLPEFNNYRNSYVSNTAMQGALIPTLSGLIASRTRAIKRLNLLGKTQHTSTSSKYAPLVKQIHETRDRGSNKISSSPFSDGDASEAAKKDNATQTHNHNQHASTTDETKVKVEDSEKEELRYKSMLKSAEMAANLADAAKTLTNLVKKLTAQDTKISQKQEEEHAKLTQNNEDSYENGGQWSEWSEWSHCTTTCGGGLTYSKRRCITHFPSGHGQNCTGKGIKVRLCHVNSCKTTDAKKVNLERTLSEMAEDRSHIYKPSVSGING